MKKALFYLAILSTFSVFVSCDPESVINGSDDTDTLDYVWDTTKVVDITFSGNAITVVSENVTVDGSVATITAAGTYRLNGTLTDGQVVVNSSGIVRLIMNDVSLSNSTTSPLFVKQAHKTIIILPEGTESIIADGNSYVLTEDSLNAAIYSKDYLAIYGEGTLYVNGNYNVGIHSKDELIIESGVLDVTSVGVGIKGKDYLQVNGGNITVNSGGDGLKSDNDSISAFGYINIVNGTFSITSGGDAISATANINISGGNLSLLSGGGSDAEQGTFSTKGIKSSKNVIISGGVISVDAADNCIDANNDITINSGSLTMSSGNKPVDCDSSFVINNGEIEIAKAVKGISAHYITVNGGQISVYSTNDCVKATRSVDLTVDDGSKIVISGGTVLLYTKKGDALDSNGSIDISGGTVVIQGSATSPDDVISYRSTCVVTGGTITGVGATSLLPQDVSTQNTVLIKFSSVITPSTYVNIQDASGNNIVTLKTKTYAYCIVASLPGINLNTTYNVYTGGTATGADINGYIDNAVYTPGTLKGSFSLVSVSSTVTL
ncbi:MAG: carbohydrate-binding domain-containing protein [Paludibacter sp.]|nr:carbohydrate-binding domain-containing protein [Paludibacter sp.]